MKKVGWLVAVAMLGVVGCDAEMDESSADTNSTDTEEELGEAEQAHKGPFDCPIIMVSEDVDLPWVGGYSQTSDSPSGGYGTGTCDAHVVNFSSAGTTDDLDRVEIWPYTQPTTESDCLNSYLSYRVWQKVSGTWTYVAGANDTRGVWVDDNGFQYCGLGAGTWLSSTGLSDVRVWGQLHRHSLWGGDVNQRVTITGYDSPFD